MKLLHGFLLLWSGWLLLLINAECDQEVLDSTLALEKPEWEQLHYGMDENGVVIRITPVFPPALRGCLKSWSVIQRKNLYDDAVTEKYPASQGSVDLKVTLDKDKNSASVTVLADFATGNGDEIVGLMSPQSNLDVANCLHSKPDVENLTISQVSYGEVQLSWDLKMKHEACQDYYPYGVKYTAGGYNHYIDSNGARVARFKAEDRTAVLRVPKDQVMIYHMFRTNEDGEGEVWSEDDYQDFRSTEGGGCADGYREPKFKGENTKPVVSVNTNRGGDYIPVTVSWAHLEIENADCVDSFILEWFEDGNSYDGQGEDVEVPGNQTEMELTVKRNQYRTKMFQVRVAPTWQSQSWFPISWKDDSPTATFEV